ncbi:MAG: CHASE2 domain-containing protein [Cyanobacteria bacterium P01_E01_bin.45]
MRTYQAGGSLDAQHPYYIQRPADRQLYEALLAGEFCSVLNARQMGKSSLMVQVMSRLQQEGIRCATIDMSRICGEGVTPEQFYKGMAIELWRSLGLMGSLDLLGIWRGWGDLAPVQKWSLAVDRLLDTVLEVVNSTISEPKTTSQQTSNKQTSNKQTSSQQTSIRLVVFVDEVDSLLHLPFPVYDFLATLRSYYNQRSLKSQYTHLTFALIGTATPAELMGDRQATPFNIGTSISLSGLRLQDAQPLARGLEGHTRNPDDALQAILDWTGGQPFLTQRVCQLVAGGERETESLPAGRETISDRQLIADIVTSHVIDRWEVRDVPEHLRTIRDRLTRNPTTASRLLGLYKQVLRSESSQDTLQSLQAHGQQPYYDLLLSGIVSDEQGQLRVKNPIYRTIFDEAWVEQQLAELRPYATAFDRWLRAQGDSTFLLRGAELDAALAWSASRRLSDEDYRYLAASQDLAKQQTLANLDALERASQLLADSRQQARADSRSPTRKWVGTFAIAIGTAIPIVLLRTIGLLQGWEWNAMDLMVRWRAMEPPDPRIAIVTVDEQDIEFVGRWPLPDAVLAEAVSAISEHNPRAIGLDFHRNLPVNPGHEQLVEVFRTTPQLVGIERAIGDRLPAAPELERRGQVGFSDVVLDSDGTVRRALLSVQLGEGDIRQSFAVRLALNYLQDEEIGVAPVEGDAGRLRVGRQIFERFEPNDGGYVRADAGGFQVLLNYRGSTADFDTIPLREVLQGNIPDERVRDRVVLIGLTAQSASDWFLTPYSDRWFGFPKISPGVVIHANTVSQILGAALDGRSLIRVWPSSLEIVWIVAWAVVGSALVYLVRSLRRLAAAVLVAEIMLVVGCAWGFGLGWWIPLVPPLLACVVAAGVTAVTLEQQREYRQFRSTLARLVEAQAQDPLVGRIALEYLHQSEPPARQMLVKRHLKSGIERPISLDSGARKGSSDRAQFGVVE